LGKFHLLTEEFEPFYLPHMEYEGSIGLVTENIKIFIAYFNVLGPLIAKKSDELVGRVLTFHRK
jgi:hypothetical protein